MVLRFERVTPIVSHELTRPDARGVTHGHSGQGDARQPDYHRRFSQRSDVLSAAWRRQGISRVCPCLSPVPWLSAQTQGDLWWRRPDPSLALCARPAGRSHHLAHPVYAVQSRVHGPPALRLTLSPDAPGGRPRCLTGNAWRAQFGTVRRHLPYLPHGPLSLGLCVWPPESGHGADPVWATPPHLFSGR